MIYYVFFSCFPALLMVMSCYVTLYIFVFIFELFIHPLFLQFLCHVPTLLSPFITVILLSFFHFSFSFIIGFVFLITLKFKLGLCCLFLLYHSYYYYYYHYYNYCYCCYTGLLVFSSLLLFVYWYLYRLLCFGLR